MERIMYASHDPVSRLFRAVEGVRRRIGAEIWKALGKVSRSRHGWILKNRILLIDHAYWRSNVDRRATVNGNDVPTCYAATTIFGFGAAWAFDHDSKGIRVIHNKWGGRLSRSLRWGWIKLEAR